MTTTTDAFKAAEQRGYAKGYAAGKRARARVVASDSRQAKQQAFAQRAFLAVLPWVFEQDTWGTTANGVHTPYKTKGERIKFAASIAEEALQVAVTRGMV